ncbi:QRFP-like peptide receptor [Patiria miniata]|uniref:G-protein coupled receptors family 1 profile domain-containing protein n=1 Tax=Patiria miniata TaxID=46514 RepID=A0A914ASI3_PATMI|nr:QRFP-like peptide receptor [Patiria miniata]
MDPTTEMTSLGGHPTDGVPDLIAGNQDNGTTPAYDDDYDLEYAWFLYYLERHLTIAIYAITISLGTIGNLIVVYTIWRCRHLHTVMYTLIASLCMADLIMLCLVLPWKLNISLVYGHFPYGDFMCRAPTYLHMLSAVSSVLHLTAISLERCYAVKFPLRSRTVLTVGNAYKIVTFVWIAAVLSSIPSFFQVGTRTYVDDKGPFDVCQLVWTKTGNRAYALYQFFLVFGVPMVLITGAYAFIMHTLCTRRVPSESTKSGAVAMSQSRKYQAGSARNGSMSGSVYVANGTQKLNHKSAKNKEAEIRQMTTMIMLIVVMFIICWGPLLSFTIVKRFELVDIFENRWHITDMVFNLMSFLNSAINPIVYALVSASFRQSCIWALKVCCKSRKVRRRPSGVSKATTVSRVGLSHTGGSTVTDNVSVSSACAADKV